MNKLKAFHNKKSIKNKYIARVKAHYEADEIIQGNYWENGKGCAVGCTIHSSSHDAYPKKLGISWRLALLEDSIFENLQNSEAKKFPLQFLQAVPVGADTELVYKKFMIWVLGDKKDGLVNIIKNNGGVCLLKKILALYKKSLNTEIKQSEWKTLSDEVYSASASVSASVYSASASAYSASASVSASVYSASAYAYAYASGKFKQDVFDKRIIQMRDKLLSLLKSAK